MLFPRIGRVNLFVLVLAMLTVAAPEMCTAQQTKDAPQAKSAKTESTEKPAQQNKKATPRRRPAHPSLVKVTDDPKLPRVLLIGDSISMGYTLPVREMLKGKANVHRIPTNGGPTTRGLEQIDKWLGDGNWDVIHFNWGLHDLKYMDAKGNLIAVDKGTQQVPLDEYQANLEKLVKRLKKTNARLIWCNTTPVPAGSAGRVQGEEVRYNEVAKEVMEEHDIAIDDLHTFSNIRLGEIQRKANVHFTDDGSKALAQQVVKSIEAALPKSGESN